MPFDSEITEKSRDILVLERAQETLKRTWVNHIPQRRGQHCILTALSTETQAMGPGLSRAVEALFPDGCDGVAKWNDTPGRTKAEVLALFDIAIARLTAHE